jgi:imidazole glycerol-phosphate synthase subunit HisH
VPHMGWNTLAIRREDPLLANLAETDRLYFVHSFAGPLSGDTLASVDYGSELPAIVRRGNFLGVQFHPERSSTAGARVLRNFLSLPCS